MLRQTEGSRAVAETVAYCRPEVIAAYPISPQTHIVEELSRLVKSGALTPCEYVNVESEFAAMSMCVGASAAGARAYTATASQGLLYMVEALYNAAGLGLPIVMTVANRAIGAPINIWNDHSDSMSQRDSGWIQLYARDNQEAADLHPQAFRLAEKLSLPVMVCMDGFVLTHAWERVEVPERAQVDAFLPPYEPRQVLDPQDPVSIGAMVGPDAFTEVRYLAHAKQMQALDAIPRVAGEFREVFGRTSGGLVHPYRCEDAETLDAEIERITALGVALEPGTRVDDVLAAQHDGGFDAVFLAVGAGIGKRAYIPAGDSARILDAVSLLAGMEGAGPPLLGRRVAVYGGGDTAMDAARTARRLGATDAVVVYRRTRDRMPAHDVEVEEALEEGVRMKWLSTIEHADGGRLSIERMRLDDTGFPQPTGEFEDLDADTVVLALGQESDLSLLRDVPDLTLDHGLVQVADGLMTGHQGIFAGGDMVPDQRTVTVAVGHGKRAARHIDAYLSGTSYDSGARHPVAEFGNLNTWYYSDAPASVRPRLELARRVTTFDEVVRGLDESTALFEARRCMSCGNCFECDNCYGVCPDNAITKLGPGKGFAIDLDYCKGCGLCAAECPCGAIEMTPEDDAGG